MTTKCSRRINAAIKAIEEYSIVKFDFIKQVRLEALAASPAGFVSRKMENCFVNYKKKTEKAGTGPAKAENEEKKTVAAPRTKTQTKSQAKSQGNKRKAVSPPPSDDESEKDYDDLDESEKELSRPAKRARGASKGQ